MRKSELANIKLPGGQSGVVLIVGLIMLLLMTVVGLAAIRGSGLQESMAGNMRDRNLAFQAAEAGLRVGENFVETTDLDAVAFDGTTTWRQPDLFTTTALAPVGDWTQAQWEANGRLTTMELKPMTDDNQPRFVVEELIVPAQQAAQSTGSAVGLGSLQEAGSMTISYYRITSRGVSGTGDGAAVVQSNYRKN